MKYISIYWVYPLVIVLVIADWQFGIMWAGNLASFYLWMVNALLLVCIGIPPEKIFTPKKKKPVTARTLYFLKILVLVLAGWFWVAGFSLFVHLLYLGKKKKYLGEVSQTNEIFEKAG